MNTTEIKQKPLISIDSNYGFQYASNFLKNEKVQRVAKAALIDLCLCLFCAGLTSLFVATPIGVATLFAGAIFTVIVNAVFRAFLESDLINLKDCKVSESANKALSYMPAFFFTAFDKFTRECVTHEAGHFIAIKLLYKTLKNPSIEVFPSTGGAIIRFTKIGLTRLGSFVGETTSNLLIAAAGTISSIFLSVIGFVIADCLKDKYPELSRYLNITGIIAIAQSAFYALSAFWASGPTAKFHDFVVLAAGGIHPIISVIVIIAIPLLVKVGLHFARKLF